MNVLKILLFKDSRKVGFGAWLFIVSTFLLGGKHISGDDWMLCMWLSSALVGGGTLADKWLNGKGVSLPGKIVTSSSNASTPEEPK